MKILEVLTEYLNCIDLDGSLLVRALHDVAGHQRRMERRSSMLSIT